MSEGCEAVLMAYCDAGIPEPHPFQKESWNYIVNGKNVLISAGTGSGKTEAAFLPALATGKRIILLYPTKALLQDQVGRVEELAKQRTIAVDTGDEDDRTFYRADIILTSLDKFLYRFLGYGKKRWSYLYPYRIAISEERSTILIFDEAHAYEDVAFSHFWFVLKKLSYERQFRGVQTLLLSATLSSNLVNALVDVDRAYFPRGAEETHFFESVEDNETRSGQVVYEGVVDASDVVSRALNFFDQGKRVIIVLNTVVAPGGGGPAKSNLHSVWKELTAAIALRSGEQLPIVQIAKSGADGVNGKILAYHGHQMPGYRKQVLSRIRVIDAGWKADNHYTSKNREAFILVTTSAMEVGVDISCDVMITDLCEPDSFVQRTGRCARRNQESGSVYVIAGGASKVRSGKLLRDFLDTVLVGSPLDTEVKKKLNAMNATSDLERVHLRLEYLQDLNLHRYVYDFVEENREIWETGTIVTRDWEPSIAVVRGERHDEADYIGGIPARDFWRGKEIREKLVIPLSGAADLAGVCAWVVEGYNEGSQYTQRLAVGGSRERSLSEALKCAGLSPRPQRSDANKIKAVYGLGMPLILILPSNPALNVFPSDELGIIYRKRRKTQWMSKSESDRSRWPAYTRPPNDSVLATFGVVFSKNDGAVELPVYWFEPREDNTDEG